MTTLHACIQVWLYEGWKSILHIYCTEYIAQSFPVSILGCRLEVVWGIFTRP